MTPAQRGQAVDELAVIRIMPCPKGLRRFDPAYVRLPWLSPATVMGPV